MGEVVVVVLDHLLPAMGETTLMQSKLLCAQNLNDGPPDSNLHKNLCTLLYAQNWMDPASIL